MSLTYMINAPKLSPSVFLHTVSNQKLDDGKPGDMANMCGH